MFDTALIDAKMMFYRQFYMHHHNNEVKLSTKFNGKDIYTGMLYGTLNTLVSLQKEYNPKKIIFLHDGENYEDRIKLLKDYKANRNREYPQDFEPQLELTIGVLALLGITQIKAPKHEADDLIATWTERLQGTKLIISSDKDLYCLLQDNNTAMLRHQPRKQLFTAEDFKEKFGFEPHLHPAYLALVGDKTDNINGVPRIGPITATEKIKHANNFKDVAASLRPENKKIFLFNMRLVTLNNEIRTSEMVQIRKHDQDFNMFIDIMQRLSFKSMLLPRNADTLRLVHENNKGYKG
jgi:DNA polymerase-1